MVSARVYAIIVSSILLLGLFFYATTFFYASGTLFHAAVYLISMANLGTVYYLFATGSLGRSWPRPYYFLLLSLMTLGILFQVQYWDYGDTILGAAFAGLAVLYLVWYLTKRKKLLADHLKVLWVSGFCAYALCRVWLHTRNRTAEYALMVLLWIIFALVNYHRWQLEQRRRLQSGFSPELLPEEEEN